MDIRLTLWPEADSPLYIHNHKRHTILVIAYIHWDMFHYQRVSYMPLMKYGYTPDPLAGGGFPIIYTQSQTTYHTSVRLHPSDMFHHQRVPYMPLMKYGYTPDPLAGCGFPVIYTITNAIPYTIVCLHPSIGTWFIINVSHICH
jgi:hypothetical protein